MTKRTKSDIFVPENAKPETRKTHYEDWGDTYYLEIMEYETGEGYWNYSEGRVYEDGGYEDDRLIAVIQRNYPSFPFTFFSDHPDGHDYLICGEDYQGQTVIQLDTGERVDYLPPNAKKGRGFCWTKIEGYRDYTDRDNPKPILKVEGCYWGAPYEVHVYDFSEPMSLPYKQLQEWHPQDMHWTDDE